MSVLSKTGAVLAKIYLFCLLAVAPISVQAAILGASPPTIDLGTFTVGEMVTDELTVVRGSDDYSAVKIDLSGSGKNFVDIEKVIEFPSDQRILKIPFSVNASPDAAGRYQAYFDVLPVLPSSDGEKDENITLASGLRVSAAFEVINNGEISYGVADQGLRELEDGSIQVFFSIKNMGSVDWRPDEIQYSMSDPYGYPIDLISVETADLSYIKPGEARSYEQVFLNGNNVSEYIVEVLVKKNNVTVLHLTPSAVEPEPAEDSQLSMNLLPSSARSTLTRIQAGQRDGLVNLLLAAVALLLLVGIAVAVIKKRSSSKAGPGKRPAKDKPIKASKKKPGRAKQTKK